MIYLCRKETRENLEAFLFFLPVNEINDVVKSINQISFNLEKQYKIKKQYHILILLYVTFRQKILLIYIQSIVNVILSINNNVYFQKIINQHCFISIYQSNEVINFDTEINASGFSCPTITKPDLTLCYFSRTSHWTCISVNFGKIPDYLSNRGQASKNWWLVLNTLNRYGSQIHFLSMKRPPTSTRLQLKINFYVFCTQAKYYEVLGRPKISFSRK